MPKTFKWSKDDNTLAAAEVEMADFLYDELKRRPSISARLLLASVPVCNQLGLMANEAAWQPTKVRPVTVEIDVEDQPRGYGNPFTVHLTA